MHLHGHDFFLIAEGKGIFNESVLRNANLINPTRRDVVTMPVSDPTANVTGGYIVIAFPLTNPGVWVKDYQVVVLVNRSFCIAILGGICPWVSEYSL